METNFLKISAALVLTGILSACVVAPPQPLGYRMTSNVLPTYVNGQYVGMQSSSYVAADVSVQQPVASQIAAPAQVAAATVSVNPAPVYIQTTTPSVVYLQAPAPVAYYAPTYYAPSYYGYSSYGYNLYPTYPPYYAGPWFGGVGVGIGVRFGGGYGWRHGRGR